MGDIQSLSHTVWDCKYHVVWIPKCRRKVLYGQLRQYLGQVLREFRRKGIPTFNLLETTCTVNKGHRYIFYIPCTDNNNPHLLYETPAELPVDQAPPKHHLKALIRRSVQEGRTLLNEDESKKLLKDYGIPVSRSYITANIDDALASARETGYPVVLKIVSPDITHKTDVGGVVTGISTDDQLRDEYDRLIRRVKERRPEAVISGVSVPKR